jgi:metallo-beta-lactamase family protein
VTGSRFLLENGEHKVLVDAGLFQGLPELRQRNWDPLPVNAHEIEAVVVTHAHLDHCGYLPKLVANEYRGKIHLTHFTAKLAGVVLRDSASLQIEDSKYAKKHGYSKHKDPLPLYNVEDAEKAISLFAEEKFHTRINIAPDTYATFFRSGHILGASSVLVEFHGKNFYFSGDLGRPNHPILLPPDSIPQTKIDALIVESTYGDREHPAKSNALAESINRTIELGGSVLIPAFSIDRTEILLMSLKELVKSGEIPLLPIYIDSPMALTALHYYEDAIRDKDDEIRPELLNSDDNPFDVGDLREAKTVDESKALNEPSKPCIIISASGMATGGRVVHHLERMLPDSNNAVLLVGYQAIGTRGHLLLSGAKELKMYGGLVPVRAEIVQIEEFSVHGDASELIDWIKSGSKPDRLFVVHGEKNSAESFAQKVNRELNWNTEVPVKDKSYVI